MLHVRLVMLIRRLISILASFILSLYVVPSITFDTKVPSITILIWISKDIISFIFRLQILLCRQQLMFHIVSYYVLHIHFSAEKKPILDPCEYFIHKFMYICF